MRFDEFLIQEKNYLPCVLYVEKVKFKKIERDEHRMKAVENYDLRSNGDVCYYFISPQAEDYLTLKNGGYITNLDKKNPKDFIAYGFDSPELPPMLLKPIPNVKMTVWHEVFDKKIQRVIHNDILETVLYAMATESNEDIFNSLYDEEKVFTYDLTK